MRPSRQATIAAAGVLAAFACSCGPRTLVVVDPDPCFDGGTGPGCPGPVTCTDGGVMIGGVQGCVPFALIDGLVGYWRLDDGTGSTIANDVMDRNDGTLSADLNASTAWVRGISAGALDIAADGFVNVPVSPTIDSIVDQVTIMGWGYLVGTTIMDYATIASREVGTTIDQHYHISINSRGEVPALWLKTEVGTELLQGPAAVTRQTWVHIAGTYDGAMARLYVNGQQVDTQPITGRFAADTTPFILGANGNGAGDASVSERFPGRIDEIMLYRRALTADEVRMLYEGALFPSQFRADGGARD